jgi:hypothetical protein
VTVAEYSWHIYRYRVNSYGTKIYAPSVIRFIRKGSGIGTRLTLEAASLSSFCFCSKLSIDIGTLLIVGSGKIVVVAAKLFNRRWYPVMVRLFDLINLKSFCFGLDGHFKEYNRCNSTAA